MERYKTQIDKLIDAARAHSERLQERESDLAGQRADALEEFADALEAAIDELTSAWEE